MSTDRQSPPAPAVTPDVYDERYFREACAGFEEWTRSEGREAAGIYAGALERAGLRAGEVVVDLGTGRGELPVVAVERGAARAFGVEYSAAAVRLARQTVAAHGVADRVEVFEGDVRAVPLDDGVADLATMLDVVEHLTPAELDAALREARRLLRPGGRLLAHTMPNRTVYAVTYRLQRALQPARWRRWPADPRNDWEHRMHVNEQTLRSLRGALRRAGFVDVRVELGAMVYDAFVPDERARPLLHRLAARRATAALGRFDLWGAAVRGS